MIEISGQRITAREVTRALKAIQKAADDYGYIEDVSLVDILIKAGFDQPKASLLNRLLGALQLRSTERCRVGGQATFNHVVNLTTPSVTEQMLRSLDPIALRNPAPGTTFTS